MTALDPQVLLTGGQPAPERPALDEGARRVPMKNVAMFFGVSARTIDRWLVEPALGFPRPVYTNKRRYWRVADILSWAESRKEKGPMTEKTVAADAAEAHVFGMQAMRADMVTKHAIDALMLAYPEGREAIRSGMFTALVRFSIEQLQADAGPQLITERDVIGHWIKDLQRTAHILLSKPAGAAN